MPQFDLPLDELWSYRPQVAEPADFDAFWRDQISAATAHDLALDVVPVETHLTYADVYDVTFAGHAAAPIKAWLLIPRAERPGAPVVVEYVGYGGGRGDPLEWSTYAVAGYPHLIMDTRGQGGTWRTADTLDPGDNGQPSHPGFLTRGIAAPSSHYYTRLFIDASRAVEAARAIPSLRGRPVVVTGGSQGGALALAAAHLAPTVAAVAADVPFLAHVRRASEITDAEPYAELARYCRVRPDEIDHIFETLSYLDVVNHARRVRAPALISVGLCDVITPPSTVFAALHALGGPKDVRVYSYSGHEGGEVTHLREKLAFLARISEETGETSTGTSG